MTIESLIDFDPKLWPLAIMAFLRVVSVFVWLPVFGDAAVPTRLRIVLALMFTFFLWPMVHAQMTVSDGLMRWSPIALALATLREAFFGFAVGFSARMVLFGTSLASQLVGINMGFQTASLFSPSTGTQESAFSSFKGWIVVILLLSFNVHHVFLTGIAQSFLSVPIAPSVQSTALARVAIMVVESSCVIGIKLAAPILMVQIVSTIAMGLLNRAIPQLNALVLNFPVSFLLSMVVLFASTVAFVRVIGTHGVSREVFVMGAMQRAFSKPVQAPARE